MTITDPLICPTCGEWADRYTETIGCERRLADPAIAAEQGAIPVNGYYSTAGWDENGKDPHWMCPNAHTWPVADQDAARIEWI